MLPLKSQGATAYFNKHHNIINCVGIEHDSLICFLSNVTFLFFSYYWVNHISANTSEAIIILPSVCLAVKRWWPWGLWQLLALRAAFSRQSSEASNWTAALWMAKCWGSKHSPFHWVVPLHHAVDLTTRRCSRPSDWIYSANMVPKLSFTHHCQLPSCIPRLFLRSNICNTFLWFMRHILVNVLTAACVCFSPCCPFGCWRKVWALRFLGFFSIEAVDKGKGEALMFWQQFAALIDRGERLNTRRT